MKEFVYKMALIRATEEALLDLYSKGMLRGTVHTCIGQEACAVGVVSAIDRSRDLLFSNHRGHGHYLAYSGDVRGLIAEVMGRADGVCLGIGGSQHLHRENYYSNGILGAGTPIAAGMALAEKLKGTGAVALAFMGDGTFGEGVVYESFNIASLWQVPLVYVVEHNGYAQTTPARDQHAGQLCTRATSFGIPVISEDGMNVTKVNEAARKAMAAARSESRPYMLFLDTYRFAPHSKGDDHRDPDEIARNVLRDPIRATEAELGSAQWLNLTQLAQADVSRIVAELVRE